MQKKKNVNYATQLNTVVDRILDNIVDNIAKDGLVLLKKVLDSSGFADSEYLKDYEVYAHVTGHSITFEILLDTSAIDEIEQEKSEEAKEKAEKIKEKKIERASRSYGIVKTGPARVLGVRDARSPAIDARTDNRKNSKDRLVEHEIALVAPRGLSVKRNGKVSLKLKRTARETDTEFIYPKRDPEGIIKEFLDKLSDITKKNFLPELEKAISKYASQN
jgi:hypothetical protein